MSNGNNDLFNIDKIAHEDGIIRTTLGINSDSEILKGHFPDQPVVPGACMLQIVKETLETALNSSLRLRKADYLKFIAVIDPLNTQTVQLDISYKYVDGGAIKVNAKLSNGKAVCFKFQGGVIRI
jgi:3-hydroxyacyl-[acyl-carrier-protein] dehydratase